MSTTNAMGTRQRNDILIREAHTVENSAQVASSVTTSRPRCGASWKVPLWVAHVRACSIFAAIFHRDDGPTHDLYEISCECEAY